jgi:N-acetylmuramoyl-L-alanine amidase
MNVYHEARGEPFLGQVAVAHVTLNRQALQTTPDGAPTICDVVWAKNQFSWTKQYGKRRNLRYLEKEFEKSRGKRENWKRSLRAARYALSTSDTTNGATFFHATYVSPTWNKKHMYLATIGQHHFYKPMIMVHNYGSIQG